MRNSHPVINASLLFLQWHDIGASNEADESGRYPKAKLDGPF
jgi:hypothetical protein